jgi:hypothetical protein
MLAMDFSPRRFSTGVLPERERVRAWCAEFGRTLLRVNIEPLADLPFHAEAEMRALPDVRVIKGRSSAVHFQQRMPLEPTKHVNGRMWPPGVSGSYGVRER